MELLQDSNYRPIVDLLSLTLARMRLASSMLARYDATAPWAVEVSDGHALTAYFMISGSCWYCPAGLDEPVCLGEGDLLMLPRWQQHKLGSNPDLPGVPLAKIAAQSGADVWDSTQPLTGLRILRHRPHDAAPPDAQVLVMMFRADKNYQDNLVRCLPARYHLPAADVEFCNLIAVVREFLVNGINDQTNGFAAAGHRLAELVLIELLRHVTIMRPKGTTGWLNGLGSPPIAAVITALHSDPQRRWTLDDLSAVAGLSRSQFSLRFSRIVGQSPMSYVQSVRMHWAAEEIVHGKAIKAVADELDYSTTFGFRKAFVQHFGIPPGRWRENRLSRA